MTHLRCARCWSLVAPSEGVCAGCGTVFSPEEIARAVEKGCGEGGGMKRKKSAHDKLREVFRDSLDAAYAMKFPGQKCETGWNFIAGCIVTTPVDKAKFTREQYDWIQAYTTGYEHAMEFVK